MVYRLLFPVEAESYLVSEEEEEELDDVELQDDSEEVEVEEVSNSGELSLS